MELVRRGMALVRAVGFEQRDVLVSGRGGGQRGQVVGDADEAPFVFDRVETTQQELADASGLLGLAEDRLDGDLAQAVATAPPAAFRARGHDRLQAARLRGSPAAAAAKPGPRAKSERVCS